MIIHKKCRLKNLMKDNHCSHLDAKERKERLKKFSLARIQTLDLCDTGAVLVAKCADKPTGQSSLSWVAYIFFKLNGLNQ